MPSDMSARRTFCILSKSLRNWQGTLCESIPKHEPTSSYYNLVRCIAKCMMRSDEHNRHMHESYAEETALSLNINVKDEEESKEIIVHKTLSENQSMDVSKSECNIVHKNLSQKNSADVPDNVITELKDNEHKEPSVIEKGTIYFNIFECGINILDQLDVTYKRALWNHQYKRYTINHHYFMFCVQFIS